MKIKNCILKSLFQNATGRGLSLYLFMAQFQETSGLVQGITQKETKKQLGLGLKTFYKLIHDLEKKGFVKINYNTKDYSMWTIELMGNTFLTKEEVTDYTNINITFLHTLEFHKLKKAEKIILITFLMQWREGRNKMVFTIGKIMSWTGSGLQATKKHLHALKKIMENVVGIGEIKIPDKISENKTIEFIPFYLKREESETLYRNIHIANFLCKRNKVDETNDNKKDAAKLLSQYAESEILTKDIKRKGDKLPLTVVKEIIDSFLKMYKYINGALLNLEIQKHIANLNKASLI